jgi:Ni/Fe-hydrogenase subunit HybB-like protein
VTPLGAGKGDAGDGRNIDVRLGVLSGEGAQQRVPNKRRDAEGSPDFVVWDGTPSEVSGTYYDRPVLKEPLWIWAVPTYFYVGGAAGAAAVLAEAVRLLGDDQRQGLADKARLVAGIGAPIGSALLIADLGRPERFLNMLRVFRPTSPMSVGSWILASFASVSGAAMVLERSSARVLSLAGRTAGIASGVLGGPLSGYTAVLISNTAVPLWQSARRSLPALFVSSAMSSAGGVLQMTGGNEAERRTARIFAGLGQAGELVAAEMVDREAEVVERVARPLKEGLSGTLWRLAKACTFSALLLNLLPGSSRAKGTVAGLLGNAGALCTRFGLFYAGKASARDPRATFEDQRSGRGGAEVTGRGAVTGPRDRAI